jgi:hypothetical protein
MNSQARLITWFNILFQHMLEAQKDKLFFIHSQINFVNTIKSHYSEIYYHIVGLEILTTVVIQSSIFCDIMLDTPLNYAALYPRRQNSSFSYYLAIYSPTFEVVSFLQVFRFKMFIRVLIIIRATFPSNVLVNTQTEVMQISYFRCAILSCNFKLRQTSL